MRLAELVGGVLYTCPDPEAAAGVLLRAVRHGTVSDDVLRAHGIEPRLAQALRHRVAELSETELAAACAAGAAWVLGRRSGRPDPSWEPVMSVGPASEWPAGTRRGTAETLNALIARAASRICIAAPFLDREGLDVLKTALLAALARGVEVVLIVPRTDRAVEALTGLRRDVVNGGAALHVRFVHPDSPWPHLKLMTVDGLYAYLGSANLTGAALTGRNLELGVLIRGEGVAALDAVFELIQAEDHQLPIQPAR